MLFGSLTSGHFNGELNYKIHFNTNLLFKKNHHENVFYLTQIMHGDFSRVIQKINKIFINNFNYPFCHIQIRRQNSFKVIKLESFNYNENYK